MMRNVLLTCLFLIVLALPSHAKAEAMLVLTNKTTADISIAIRYHNSIAGEWVTHGWVQISALSEEKISMDTDNGVLYFYARDTEGGVWGGVKRDPESRVYPVISGKFLVKGDQIPRGRNLSNVRFKKRTASEGVFYLTFTD